MSYANGRLGFVYVLTARSRSAEHVYFQIGGIYLQFHLIGLSKHRNRYRGCMDTSLRFGLRHSLNAVYSAFVLKSGICPISLNRETYLLESAQFRLVCVEYLGIPAASLGVHGIHTEKRTCKKRSLLASSTAAYFYNNVLVVVGVFGKQQYLQLFAKRFQSFPALVKFELGKLFHLPVAARFVQKLLGVFHCLFAPYVLAVFIHYRCKIFIFFHQRRVELIVADYLNISQLLADLFVFLLC